MSNELKDHTQVSEDLEPLNIGESYEFSLLWDTCEFGRRGDPFNIENRSLGSIATEL